MGVLTTGNTFSTGDQVTASKLNAAVNSATLQAAAVDNTSTQLSSGAIIVKDLGITQDKIASDAVGTNQLANDVVVNTSGSITGAAGSFTTLAASGVVSVPDGSESAPAITNTGDTNTGIYFPAENSVALTAGAGATLTSTNTAITIDVPTSIVSTAQSDLTLQGGDANSKNLIFKKASAQQGKISAVGDELKFYAGTSGTETLELTTTEAVVTGNLGIGVASPSKKLQISSDANAQSTAAIPGIRIENTDTTAADTNVSGEIEFFSKDASEADKISGFIKNVAEDAGTKYALTFGSKATGANATEAMRIDNEGNVGIGTASPAEELHISASVPKIQIQDSDGTDQYGQFYHSAGVTAIQARNNTADGTIVFQKYDGTTTDETMRISSSGNVGIGTVSPSAPLTVDGDVEVNVVGSSNASKGIIINSSGTNFESDAGIIQATHAGSGSLTGGYWLKFNANSADKFSVRGDGRTEISSTTGGVIMPRMTTAQKNVISSPVNGEMVYDTDLNKFYGYANGSWVAFH